MRTLFRSFLRRRLGRAAVLALAFSSRSAGAAPEELEPLLARAAELQEAGDFEAAADLYLKVVAERPAAWRARSNLGACWARLGRYDIAIDQYEQAVAVSDDPAVRHNLALALMATGRSGDAGREARHALLDSGNRLEPRLLLAECLLREGDSEGVVSVLRDVPPEQAGNRAVAYLLATGLLELGRLDEAQPLLDRVLAGDTPEGHVLLGAMYSHRGQWSAARGELEKALASRRDLPRVHFLYGQVLMKERGDWAGAAEAFRAELAIDPSHFESNLLLGTLLREEGRYDEALAHLERAGRMRGGDLALKFSLGATLLATGRLEEARRHLEDVAAAVPTHLPTQMQLAVLYARLGRPDDSARARKNAARLQKEADARPFGGVRDTITDILGAADEPRSRTQP